MVIECRLEYPCISDAQHGSIVHAV